jgi:uncharacterized LabA/DUF88 family protein
MKVLLLVDTPNLYHTVMDSKGPTARPDYAAIYETARGLGNVRAIAFVNQGVNNGFVKRLEAIGFEVVRPIADDVDHALIATAVRFSRTVDWVILCSGDGDYAALVHLLHTAGVKVAVMAVPQYCSRSLRCAADEFIETPVILAATPVKLGGDSLVHPAWR